MCLAIPSKVISIKGKTAVIKSQNHRHKVDLSLVKDVKIGDYILAHDNIAINKVSKADTKKIVAMINELSK